MLFIQCKPDAPQQEEKESSIEGKWSIHYATRNDKETKTLKGGYFDFTSDTTFVTNIFGDNSGFLFSMDGNRLVTKEGRPALNLALTQSHSDSMLLQGKIQRFRMEFYLSRDTSTVEAPSQETLPAS